MDHTPIWILVKKIMTYEDVTPYPIPTYPYPLQKLFFISRTNGGGLRWVLNGYTISNIANIVPWTPRAGGYTLVLRDRENRIIDSVDFEVRGPSNLPPLPSGERIGVRGSEAG
jgi:penicillin-binding protein 1C